MISLPLISKAVGAVAMLSSAVFWSMSQKKKDEARLLRLESQIAFVRFIRVRIDRYLSPITQIMRECDRTVMSGVLIGCSESECADVNALRVILRSGEYYSDGGEAMESFLSTLGSSYREGELAGCDDCIKELSAAYEKLRGELPRERKGRCVLALCLAAGAVIILI